MTRYFQVAGRIELRRERGGAQLLQLVPTGKTSDGRVRLQERRLRRPCKRENYLRPRSSCVSMRGPIGCQGRA